LRSEHGNPLLINLDNIESGDIGTAGIINRAGIMLVVLLTAGFILWQAYPPLITWMPLEAGGVSEPTFAVPDGLGAWAWLGTLGGFAVAMFIICNPKSARSLALPYAILEGIALTSISIIFESKFPGIAMNAAVLTFGVLLAMLIAYKLRILRPTERGLAVVCSIMSALVVIYLVDLALAMFTTLRVPILNAPTWTGIAVSVFIVGVAAYNLIFDFELIESAGKQGASKEVAWFAAFGLILSLVWLYVEILRLLVKLRSRK
jgi:uncharacterized YccA/Bax inhibitor family protein